MNMDSDRLVQLEAVVPPTAEVQRRVREYLALTQLTLRDFARRAGYGNTSISKFMGGRYTGDIASTDVRIRRAVTEYMNAHPVEISISTSGKLYQTENVALLRRWFERCLSRRKMAYVYGPPGAQKSFVLNHLVAEHNRRELSRNGHGTRAYIVYCRVDISKGDLLLDMARAAAIPGSRNISATLNNLAHHLGSRKSLFVLDEAQHLGIPVLELIRQLNDQPPFCGILLAGSHQLRSRFKQNAVALEQWESRMDDGVELPGITPAEAMHILQAELPHESIDTLDKQIEKSRVEDGYRPGKHTYISARRLFNMIDGIQSDPRYSTLTASQKAGAA